MYEYISGKVIELMPTLAIMDVGGIGYKIHISLITSGMLHQGDTAKLYIHQAIREDAHLLFGFIDREERQCFEELISVSGVGTNTARIILSTLTVSEIVQSIESANPILLRKVKGIGTKTAERIIVDLKGKLKINLASTSASTVLRGLAGETQVASEAIEALLTLGFAKAPAQKVIAALLEKEPDQKVGSLIKQALKLL